jgi:cellulose synthase/poly-beta-1,6-N-acetylglucosamine synthase-like glycosyltransferase
VESKKNAPNAGNFTMIVNWLLVIVLIHVFLTWFLSIQQGIKARRQMAHARWRYQRFPAFRPGSKIEVGESSPTQADDGSPQPSVSILVPAWNERGTIEKCIRSLQELEYPNWEALILAGGEDGTFEAAIQATTGDNHFKVLERGPEPKNAAINRGTRAAQNEILVLLDADSLVERGWLGALVEPLIAGAAACIGMHYPSRMTWVSMGEHMEIIEAYNIIGTNLGQGCSSLAIRREVLEKIGPLPENAFSWEDTDVGVRLSKAGEKVAFAPAARLLNERPATFKDYWRTAVRVHRAHLVLLWHWRKILIQRPKWGLFQVYFHVLSLAVLIALAVGLGVAIAFPAAAGSIALFAALAALWMFGRRAALGAEIAAFTRDARWLLRAWIPPVLLLIQLVTADIALFTFRRAVPFDYKGHREVFGGQNSL